MISYSYHEDCFLHLYRAGLWHQESIEAVPSEMDWEEIIDIARKQTTLGIVADGVSVLKLQLPMASKMKLISLSIATQKTNERLNVLIPKLFNFLGKAGIPTLLLKGQGVALNYINPSARQSGDIDLLIINPDAFQKAYQLFKEHFKIIEDLNPHTLEAVFSIDGVMVELHGRILSCINHTLEQKFQPWIVRQLHVHEPRRVEIGGGTALVPPIHMDVIFVFIHLARHYFAGGIGLRQVSDWMRLLVNNIGMIDREQLEKDLAYLGIIRIWQVFAAMAVVKLRYPAEHMPLYEPKYEKEGLRVLRYIFDSGNFGYHDKRTKSNSTNYYVRRFTAFTGHLQKIFRNVMMFPNETLYCLPAFVKDGLARTKLRH